ncbi:SRPBCC family protein [Cryptosporangium minutisporangium]|uniref:SRPBCC domain-containing protein n=1 Tax=Cryptosporangium minutisporangium TaxID=113569 RepID=A0ABP6T5B6_9ACTN
MTDDLTAIHVDEFLPHPPTRVWDALTNPDALAKWFLPGDFKPVVGHRFRFQAEPIEATNFSGVIAGEVLDVQPETLLSYSWVDPANPAGLDSVVTWTLHPEGTGTRLFLEHRGFDPDDPQQQLARKIMSGGWSSQVFRGLIEYLS